MKYENFVSAVEGLAGKYQKMNPGMYVFVNRTDYGLELTCMPRGQMRKQWVDQMLTEFTNDYIDQSTVVLSDANRKVVVMHFSDGWGDEGYGIAKCSPTDEFDVEVGLAVAFAHFRHYPIPDFV
jgi:hypothetical protein